MNLTKRLEPYFDKFAAWFRLAVRVVLNILIVVLVVALFVGVVKSGIALFQNIGQPLEQILQDLLLDAVFILVLTEIIIVNLAYLRDGRVQLKYVVDAILIVMLNEVVVLWFSDPKIEKVLGLSLILAVLAAARISILKFKDSESS